MCFFLQLDHWLQKGFRNWQLSRCLFPPPPFLFVGSKTVPPLPGHTTTLQGKTLGKGLHISSMTRTVVYPIRSPGARPRRVPAVRHQHRGAEVRCPTLPRILTPDESPGLWPMRVSKKPPRGGPGALLFDLGMFCGPCRCQKSHQKGEFPQK